MEEAETDPCITTYFNSTRRQQAIRKGGGGRPENPVVEKDNLHRCLGLAIHSNMNNLLVLGL
jgi:hypothetical protein